MGLPEIWQNALALFAEAKFGCLLIWSLSQWGYMLLFLSWLAGDYYLMSILLSHTIVWRLCT